jgi:hypothetical protein
MVVVVVAVVKMCPGAAAACPVRHLICFSHKVALAVVIQVCSLSLSSCPSISRLSPSLTTRTRACYSMQHATELQVHYAACL